MALVYPDGSYVLSGVDGDGIARLSKHLMDGGAYNSAIVAYRLYLDGPGVGERPIAIFVKPVGIDYLYIDYFDQSKYDLEAVWVDRNMQPAWFRTISASEFRRNSPQEGIGLTLPTFIHPPTSRWLANLWGKYEAFEDSVDLMVDAGSAKEAVAYAYNLAKKGEIVLLSPACASFDLFENYQDRGDQFKKAVKEL